MKYEKFVTTKLHKFFKAGIKIECIEDTVTMNDGTSEIPFKLTDKTIRHWLKLKWVLAIDPSEFSRMDMINFGEFAMEYNCDYENTNEMLRDFIHKGILLNIDNYTIEEG